MPFGRSEIIKVIPGGRELKVQTSISHDRYIQQENIPGCLCLMVSVAWL